MSDISRAGLDARARAPEYQGASSSTVLPSTTGAVKSPRSFLLRGLRYHIQQKEAAILAARSFAAGSNTVSARFPPPKRFSDAPVWMWAHGERVIRRENLHPADLLVPEGQDVPYSVDRRYTALLGGQRNDRMHSEESFKETRNREHSPRTTCK